MAVVGTFNHDGFREWLASRPPVIQEMARRWPPDRLYRINSGHRVTIDAYSENRTVTVVVSGLYNRVLFSRKVFGIPIDELVECDLPGPDEQVGDTAAEAGFTNDDIELILAPIREMRKRRKRKEMG